MEDDHFEDTPASSRIKIGIFIFLNFTSPVRLFETTSDPLLFAVLVVFVLDSDGSES